jgi:acetyl esterase/lipase
MLATVCRPCLAGLTLVALLGQASPAGAAAPPAKPGRIAVRALKDLAYYDGPDQHKVKHKLDLFLPEGRKDYPVLLFVHGGAWVQGDKNTYGLYGALTSCLARQGIGVAVTNYRLSPAVKHPEHVRDVARAFAWLHKNVGKYGGRADRLFVSGHSAGGHLVALLAGDETYLKEVGLTARAIRGVIPISGVYQIPERSLPAVFGTDPEVRKQASPLRHARAGLPPFLILYADKDFASCGREPSEKFCKALTEKGARAETLEIKDSNHYWIVVRAALPGNPVPQAIVKFIRAHSAG